MIADDDMIDGRSGGVIDGQMSPEQEADLNVLRAAAGEGVGSPGEPAKSNSPPEISQVDELAGIVLTAGIVLSMKWPALAVVYTRERCESVARSINPVFERLGWRVDGGEFAIYATALASVVMLGVDTRAAIISDTKKVASKPVSENGSGDGRSLAELNADHADG